MRKFIEKLRALPEGDRKAVALFSSGVLTVLLLISFAIFPSPGTDSGDARQEKKQKSGEELMAPLSIVGGEIRQSIGGIQEQWSSFGGTEGILSLLSALKGKQEGPAPAVAVISEAENKNASSSPEEETRETTAATTTTE